MTAGSWDPGPRFVPHVSRAATSLCTCVHGYPHPPRSNHHNNNRNNNNKHNTHSGVCSAPWIVCQERHGGHIPRRVGSHIGVASWRRSHGCVQRHAMSAVHIKNLLRCVALRCIALHHATVTPHPSRHTPAHTSHNSPCRQQTARPSEVWRFVRAHHPCPSTSCPWFRHTQRPGTNTTRTETNNMTKTQ